MVKELGYDSKELSIAAQRLPKVKKTGDVNVDQQALLERNCLVRIIDQCVKEPQYVLPLHAYAISLDPSSLNSDSKKLARNQEGWTGQYKLLSQIPRP